MSPIDLERLLQSFGQDRREFMRTLVLGTAYAAPLIASFSMDGLGLGVAGAVGSNLCLGGSNLGPNQTSIDISKTAAPDPVVAGQNLTYTIQVENCGPRAGNNVTWQDLMPNNAGFVSATQTGGATTFTLTTPPVGSHGLPVSGHATQMLVGDLATFQIVVTVDP